MPVAAFAGTITFIEPAGKEASVTLEKPADKAVEFQTMLYVVGLLIAALYDKVDVCCVELRQTPAASGAAVIVGVAFRIIWGFPVKAFPELGQALLVVLEMPVIE